ncbi:MAG TPA: M24 family metallopeptidase, partial [Chloroflexota bacterium]
VDAGLVEFVRSLGVDVRSSGDLISGVVAWDARQLHLHREAAVGVDAARAEAFAAAVEAVSKGQTVTEWDLVQLMSAVMASRGLVTTDPPHAATNERTADPHYAPSPEQPVEVRAGDVLLVDVWGRLDEPGAPYADTTWVAYLGERPPDELVRVFDVVARARDEALAFIESSWRAGRPVRGREVDRVARAVIEKEGYGDYFTHRTGHSLGWSHVHGEGTNLDDLEFPDDRLLRPGAGFTVEPGVYLPGRFGVRLEVSVALTLGGPEVTTAVQQRLVTP